MPKAIINAWVKYVNNLRLSSGTTSDHDYTVGSTDQTPDRQNSEQATILSNTNNQLSTHLSTYLTTPYNLLNKSFTHYPQSLLLKQLMNN